MTKIEIIPGDIIVTTIKGVPLIEHAAVASIKSGEIMVWHMVPKKGIVSEKLRDFLTGRKLIGVRKTHQNSNFINNKVASMKGKKYHLFSFNCFDFVNEVTTK